MITNVAYENVEQTQYKVTTDSGDYTITKLEAGDSNRCYQHEKIDVFLETHEVGAFVDTVDYMGLMRSERDQKIDSIYWRVQRNQTQVAGSITPSDDGAKMSAIYTYLQALRDFPAINPITTKAEYDALVWPEVPE